jgi:hypothetical protein
VYGLDCKLLNSAVLVLFLLLTVGKFRPQCLESFVVCCYVTFSMQKCVRVLQSSFVLDDMLTVARHYLLARRVSRLTIKKTYACFLAVDTVATQLD